MSRFFGSARTRQGRAVVTAVAGYLAVFGMVAVRAQQSTSSGSGSGQTTVAKTSLNKLTVQMPPNIGDFIRDKDMAIVLGKALFWDTQVGSDGDMACASCHYHAGADDRIKNQINPNANNVFDATAAGNGGPNYTLRAGDFPFHQLSDPTNRESAVLFDTNDIAGSAGIFNSDFRKVLRNGKEKDKYYPDGVFQVGSVETRRVTGRNTPSVINAVLNYRNFWDGRANNVFNGVTPFGPRDASAQIWISDSYVDARGRTQLRAVPAYTRIPFASAASQSVGPTLSAFEMSGSGRAFADIGKKLLKNQPLTHQQVSGSDSVLGKYRAPSGFGLNLSYEDLVKAAFYPEYWEVANKDFKDASGTDYRQIEMNFSLFWGLSIQMYESTLISDDTPYDRFVNGDRKALTAQQQLGLAIFSSDRGRCVECHKGAEFTGATSRMVVGSGGDSFAGDGPIENMLMGDQQSAIYDNGFYNIGVVPTGNDLGAGGLDPFGNPLSFTRELKLQLAGFDAPDASSVSLDTCAFARVDGCSTVWDPNYRDAVDGSFKTPSLRNVELTGPYFHNGGYATLDSVVEFYNRGGNTRVTGTGDSSGNSTNPTNLAPDIRPLGLSAAERAALVAFLKSLTDERVRYERAPFDHPQILIPHGAVGNANKVTAVKDKAVDEWLELPAVGAAGRTAPIQPFTPKK